MKGRLVLIFFDFKSTFIDEVNFMKLTLTAVAIALLLSGCAETWKGVKKDSSTIWDETKETTSEAVQSTKEAIHEATE
jgi:PBP1b-binding outer membrane lipoprotein LpoB